MSRIKRGICEIKIQNVLVFDRRGRDDDPRNTRSTQNALVFFPAENFNPIGEGWKDDR
jgi:hypothetical protein